MKRLKLSYRLTSSCIKMLIAYQEIITFLSEEDGQMETVLCVKRKEKEYQVDQSLCSSYRVPILRSACLKYHSHYNIKDHVLHDLRKEQLTLYKPLYIATRLLMFFLACAIFFLPAFSSH